jgi:MFS family permease
MESKYIHFLYRTGEKASIIVIPLLAEELGASYWQMGIIGGVYGSGIFISAYIFGILADLMDKKKIMVLGLGCTGMAFILQITAQGPLSLGLLRAFAGFTMGIFPPALVAYTYENEAGFGKFLSFGTLGMVAGAGLVGLISAFNSVFIVSGLCFLAGMIMALILPNQKRRNVLAPRFPLYLFKRDWVAYTSLLLRHVGAHSFWIIFPIFVEDLGGGLEYISLLYLVNYFTQFLLLNYLDRFNPRKLLLTGYSFSATSFVCYGLSN